MPTTAPAEERPALVAEQPVEAFALPLESLRSVAESVGLQWINSDVDKIRAVQEAIAAEPAPAHVARESRPAVRIDEGPLVLVETRKDLSQFKLPFETGQESEPRV